MCRRMSPLASTQHNATLHYHLSHNVLLYVCRCVCGCVEREERIQEAFVYQLEFRKFIPSEVIIYSEPSSVQKRSTLWITLWQPIQRLGELLTNIPSASARMFGLNKYLQRLTLIFFHCLSSSSSAYLFRSAAFIKWKSGQVYKMCLVVFLGQTNLCWNGDG